MFATQRKCTLTLGKTHATHTCTIATKSYLISGYTENLRFDLFSPECFACFDILHLLVCLSIAFNEIKSVTNCKLRRPSRQTE